MGKLYLGDSMLSERLLDIRDEAELNQEDMAEIFRKAGLKSVKYYSKCLGSVNIYEGTK